MVVQLRQHLRQLHVDVGPIDEREIQALETGAGQVLEEEERVRDQTTRAVVQVDPRAGARRSGSQVVQRPRLGGEAVAPAWIELDHRTVRRTIEFEGNHGVDQPAVQTADPSADNRESEPRPDQALGLGGRELQVRVGSGCRHQFDPLRACSHRPPGGVPARHCRTRRRYPSGASSSRA